MLQLRRLRRDAEEAGLRVDVEMVGRERRKRLSHIGDVGGDVLFDQPRI